MGSFVLFVEIVDHDVSTVGIVIYFLADVAFVAYNGLYLI